MTQPTYNLTNIRELLIQGFDDGELRALCFDMPNFRPVYHQLGSNSGKAEIVAKLLEHADKTLQLDTLLKLAQERNPARYQRHGPYVGQAATPPGPAEGSSGVNIGRIEGGIHASTISGRDVHQTYNVNTQGGAYIAGSVNTAGGDFVGRDQVKQTARGQGTAQAASGGKATDNVRNITSSSEAETGTGKKSFRKLLWGCVGAVAVIITIIAGIVAIMSDGLNIKNNLITDKSTATAVVVSTSSAPSPAENTPALLTPIPNPSILFFDDFSQDPKPEWQNSDDWMVIDGRYQAKKSDTTIFVGDPSWQDYTVDFETGTFSGNLGKPMPLLFG